MSEKALVHRNWRDEKGNVYGIEKTFRHGHFVVIRANPGGNHKRAKQAEAVGTAAFVQKALDEAACVNGWKEVAQ